MSKWIKVKREEIIKLSFKSTWYHKHVAHIIDAFDYGASKIKIRKVKPTQQ